MVYHTDKMQFTGKTASWSVVRMYSRASDGQEVSGRQFGRSSSHRGSVRCAEGGSTRI
jgi:hypothetical protein